MIVVWFRDPKHSRQMQGFCCSSGSFWKLYPHEVSFFFTSSVVALIPLLLCLKAKCDGRLSGISVCHSSRKELKEVKSTDLVASRIKQWYLETKVTWAQLSSAKGAWLSKCGL